MGANDTKQQAQRDHLLRQVPGIEPGTCDATQTLEVLEGYVCFLLKHIEYLTNMGVPVPPEGKVLFLWEAYPKFMHKYIPSAELNRQVRVFFLLSSMNASNLDPIVALTLSTW